ncbi:hypothetical protein FB45DRAFT_945580 [Roridomyces roridus]|uniref:Uncharacterized protein n=1 Tax=Roridomyces roridus TaxID=1738132 RepID=A0AAD7B3V4_9AGAR|nr:hypothetical protein FB45DRAFT_1010624 [Roridomyces roridus]KAJ7609159.1 hypothetical protein FB45DRAFT_945580 [Roridomyces roridus]
MTAPAVSRPQLPAELVTEIIAIFWGMPLSPQERLRFMKSSILVNSTWAAIYDRISSRDVHMPSFAYFYYLCRQLWSRRPRPKPQPPAPSIFQRLMSLVWAKAPRKDEHPTHPDLAWQSITMQVVETCDYSGLESRLSAWTGRVIGMLNDLSENSTVAPNLHHMRIECVFADQDSSALPLWILDSLPEQVTEVEILFSVSSEPADASLSLMSELGASWVEEKIDSWRAPSVRKLTFLGAEEAIVRGALQMCPNLEVLKVDTPLDCRWLELLDWSGYRVQIEYC